MYSKNDNSTDTPKESDGLIDTLNSEYIYYSIVLKKLLCFIQNTSWQQLLEPWLQKLYQTVHNTVEEKTKRNKYLQCLTLSLLREEIDGIFKTLPPNKSLDHIEDIQRRQDSFLFSWEEDTMWQDILNLVPPDFEALECLFHDNMEACASESHLVEFLDEEFQFLLYLIKPFAALITDQASRIKVALWLQTLCSVHPGAPCSSTRVIRNDYMTALLSCLKDSYLTEPFLKFPDKKLEPLPKVLKNINSEVVIDPCSRETNEFLATQPVPEDGAFCYIALTGEMLNNSSELNDF